MGLLSLFKREDPNQSRGGDARGNSIDISPGEVSRQEVAAGVADIKMRSARYQAFLITNQKYSELETDKAAYQTVRFYTDPEQQKIYGTNLDRCLQLSVETGLWVADQERRGFPAAMAAASAAREKERAQKGLLPTAQGENVAAMQSPKPSAIKLSPELQASLQQDRQRLQAWSKDPQALLVKMVALQDSHADFLVVALKTTITQDNTETPSVRGLLVLSLQIDAARREEAIQVLQQGIDAGPIADRLRKLGAKLHSRDGLPSVLRCDAKGHPISAQFHTEGKLGAPGANHLGRVHFRGDGGIYTMDYWQGGACKAISPPASRVGWNAKGEVIFADTPSDALEKHSTVGDHEYVLRSSGSSSGRDNYNVAAKAARLTQANLSR
jgi:hypothetical protein